jgi:hypothetical protein
MMALPSTVLEEDVVSPELVTQGLNQASAGSIRQVSPNCSKAFASGLVYSMVIGHARGDA